MRYLRALGFVLISFLVMGVSAPAKAVTLTKNQYTILNKAQFYGQMIGFPETIQAMVLQESSAGAGGRIGDDGNSIGVMQMKPSTAKWVTGKYTWLPQYENNYEYAQALLDDNYALLIGSLYFKECYKASHNWRRAVVCYNSGLRGASKMSVAKINSNKYLHNVKRRLKFVQKIRSVAMSDTYHHKNQKANKLGKDFSAKYNCDKGYGAGTGKLPKKLAKRERRQVGKKLVSKWVKENPIV